MTNFLPIAWKFSAVDRLRQCILAGKHIPKSSEYFILRPSAGEMTHVGMDTLTQHRARPHWAHSNGCLPVFLHP